MTKEKITHGVMLCRNGKVKHIMTVRNEHGTYMYNADNGKGIDMNTGREYKVYSGIGARVMAKASKRNRG